MGFKAGIKFNPKDIVEKSIFLQHDFRNETDKLIFKFRDMMVHEMKKAAPGPAMNDKLGPIPQKYGPFVDRSKKLLPRSGRLRRGIRGDPIKRAGSGNLDRRANVSVTSNSPHTIYVVRGAKQNIGEGGKGKGAFLPGVRKRSRYGFYPGFIGYDFVSDAAINAEKKVGVLTKGAMRTLERKFRRRLG